MTRDKALEQRIAEKMADGRYASADEVMTAALDRLDEWEAEQAAKLEALRAEIRKGLESGPPMPMDWDDFWQRAEARVGKKAAVHDTAG